MATTFRHCVPLQCTSEAGVRLEQSLESHVQAWLRAEKPRICFLLREFGDGKSFFTYVLARKLSEGFQSDP
jgi:hypothetical protein